MPQSHPVYCGPPSPGPPANSMLNPDLDRKSLAARFAEDGRLRIDDVLRPEIAERIRKYCLDEIPFDYLSYVDGANVAIPAEAMATLGTAEQRDMQDKILANASEGIGFLYCGYMAESARREGCNANLKFLHSVFDYVNGKEMLSFINEVTGREDLQSAFAQYTRYTPGQFLTRQQDDITNEQRHIAYVLGFSKNWHPDWCRVKNWPGVYRVYWANALCRSSRPVMSLINDNISSPFT